MVNSSKRSPSPFTSRSNPNLPRSLEAHQTQSTRKSFNGTNTFTRPSHLEEKENEKGQFLKVAAKLRSPSNGSKNFMAPTISAASKFTPSPRKNILVERNDPVRTSITISDGKATFFSSISSDLISDFNRNQDGCPEQILSSQQTKAVLEEPIVSKSFKKVSFKEVTFNPHSSAESFIQKLSINSDNINLSCPPPEPEAFIQKLSINSDNINLSCPPPEPEAFIQKLSINSDNINLSCPPPEPESFIQKLSINSDNINLSCPPPEPESFIQKLSINSDNINLSCPPPEPESFIQKLSINSDNINLSCPPPEPESFIQKLSINSDNINLSCPPPEPEAFIQKLSINSDNINLSCPPPEPVISILSSPKTDVVKINPDGYVSDENKQLKDTCMCELSENEFSDGLEQSETGDSEDVSSIQPIVSESLPVSTPMPNPITENNDVPKQKMESHPFRNWKSVCFILVLLGSFMLAATNFPTMHSLVPKDLNFELSEWSEVGEIVKAKVEVFTGKVEQLSGNAVSYLNKMDFSGKVKQWSADAISYLNEIVLPVLEADKIGPLQFMNLTVLEDDYEISSFFDVNSKGKGFEEDMGLELEEDEDEEAEDEIEQEIEKVENEMEEEEVEDEMKEDEEIHNIFDSAVHMVSAPEAPDTMESKMIEDEMKDLEETDIFDSTVHMVSAPEAPDTMDSKKMVDNRESYLDAGLKAESVQIPKEPESSFGESELQAQTTILGICLVLLGVSTVAAIIYLNQLSKKRASTYAPATSPIFKKKIEFLQQKEPSIEEVIAEPCASEMSTSQRSSSSYQNKKNAKRESLVYSSEYSFGSTSYGSFTTYETIPIRHGDGDEEITTPVRRSSRIRKQITSQ